MSKEIEINLSNVGSVDEALAVAFGHMQEVYDEAVALSSAALANHGATIAHQVAMLALLRADFIGRWEATEAQIREAITPWFQPNQLQ